jgi:hypothetical protein
MVRFLEEKVVCNFGVPKYVLIDNGSEWMKEVDVFLSRLWNYSPIHCTSMAIVQQDGGAPNIDHQTWSYRVIFNTHRDGIPSSQGYSLATIVVCRPI